LAQVTASIWPGLRHAELTCVARELDALPPMQRAPIVLYLTNSASARSPASPASPRARSRTACFERADVCANVSNRRWE
jgi:hypothetical protein